MTRRAAVRMRPRLAPASDGSPKRPAAAPGPARSVLILDPDFGRDASSVDLADELRHDLGGRRRWQEEDFQ